MKPFKIENSDPVTVLSFLRQSKKDFDFNEVLGDVVMWLLPSFTAKPPASSLTICLPLTNNDDASFLVCLVIKRQARIYTYTVAINLLLNSYTTDNVITKAASEVKSFMKENIQTLELFA